ncbi:MAG: hypothetical protein ACQEVA_21475 [Myxococcota bacterium]
MPKENWKDLILDARQRLFVGRGSEIEECRGFVDDDDRRVLYVHGVGGIGKTTLLYEVKAYAEQQGWTTRWLDATLLGDSAPQLEEAFLDAADSATGERVLLFLDNFEALVGMEKWLRDSLFPKLPANLWLAIAGRPRLPQSWRLDPAWSQLTRTISLGPFDQEESRAFLDSRGIDPDLHERMIEMAHGMPIALALLAENAIHETDTSQLLTASDIGELVERLTQRHATPAQRRALHVAGLTWAVTEGLLDAVIEDADAVELMQWLADQPYMQITKDGLQPHPVVRELIDEQFRTTQPEERAALRDAIKNIYYLRFRQFSPSASSFDVLFLFREGRGAAPRRLSTSEVLYYDRPSDTDDILSYVEQFEGAESAEIAGHWLERFPQYAEAIRSGTDELKGFLQIIPLEQCTEQDRRADPAVDLVLDALDDLEDLREGETARLARHWFAVDSHQGDSPVQGQIMMKIMRGVSMLPNATHGATVHMNPEYWDNRGDKFLRKLGEFELGDHRFAIYSRDWRRFDRVEFLDRHLRFALTGERDTTPLKPRFDVLSRDEFADAVRDAFKNFHRGDRLVAGQLASSRVALLGNEFERSPDQIEDDVRTVLEQAVASLGDDGQDMLHRDVLTRAFLQPSAKQRAVADEMSMSYGTFRRRLDEAIDRVVERLWHREVHGRD